MKLASIASNRLEQLLGRIVGMALLVNCIEPLINGLFQLDQLNQFGVGLLILFVFTSVVAGISGWTSFGPRLFKLHAVSVLVIMLVAPLGVQTELDGIERPWVWWALGMASVAFGVSQRSQLRYLMILLFGLGWFAIYGFGFDQVRSDLAVLDALYLIVFSIAIVSLTDLVRQGAADVDEANSEAIESALERAQTDAIERERQRVDALLHDQVLHTLLLAARAETKDEQLAAARSASAAIESLTRDGSERGDSTSSLGLVEALERAVAELDSRVQVRTSGADSVKIPASVAEAITEATLQALDNAIQHSRAENIWVSLSAKKGSLDFEIKDDGIGFRLDRISRYRIGIKTSILARMQSVGGSANVNSTPQQGTIVRLRWFDA